MSNEDGAFFAGELDSDLGEREIEYPDHITQFKERRKERMDAKRKDVVDRFKERRRKRLDAKEDEEGRWITTENDHKIHLNEEGVPDKGNPHVIQAMNGGDREGYEVRRANRRMAKAKSAIKEIDDAYDEFRKADLDLTHAESNLRKAKRIDEAIDVRKSTLEDNGIKKGDRDKLEKKAGELGQKVKEMSDKSNSDPDYRRENRERLEQLKAEHNKTNYLLSCYDDVYDEEAYASAFFGGVRLTTAEAQKAYDKAVGKKEAAEKRMSSARSAFGEIKGKADKERLYSQDERKAVVDEVASGNTFSGMTDEGKAAVRSAIEKMPDAQLAILKKTMGNAKIINAGDLSSYEGSTSWYTEGTGAIHMSSEDMKKSRTAFHEYGHFLDDPKMSGCGMGTRDFGYAGSEYTRSMSGELSARKVLHGEGAKADVQKIIGDKATVVTNESGDWLGLDNGSGDTDSFETYAEFSQAVGKRMREYVYRDKEWEDYCKEIGLPDESERPKWDDYFVTYTTPKRGITRTKEKFKGAQDKWREALVDYDDRRDAAIAKDKERYFQMTQDLGKRRDERERQIGPVSDIMCGIVRGKGMWIYGSHSADYYAMSDKPAQEAIANYHQMRSMGWDGALGLLRSLVPSVEKGLSEVYDEWLWRNLDER